VNARTRNLLFSVAIAATVATVVFWSVIRKPANSPEVPNTASEPAEAEVDADPAPPAGRGTTNASAADGGASGTPLPALRIRLEGAARSGDARAACRLAIETQRCQLLAFSSQMAASGIAGKPLDALQAVAAAERDQLHALAPISAENREMLDQFEASSERRRQGCGEISPAQADEALRFLRQAALAGVPDAQQVYVGGEGWALATPGALAHPMYDMWEREAPALLLRMLDEGHPEAPGMLAMAYGGIGWMSGLFETDRERAAAYGLLNVRLLGKPSPVLETFWLRALDPAAQARARIEAERLHGEHYEGRRAIAGPALSALSAPVLRDLTRAGAPAPCAPP
jgi:hypothetical protein